MTYPPQPEPFAEALGEAAHTAAMAYRLVLTITDAVRRAVQKRLTGREEELGEDAEKMAPGWSAGQLRGVLGDDILAALMEGADWPVMARQLVGLHQAGVDLGTFLPQMGRMTAAVHQAVVANAARTKAEGTDQWADLLKATMPEGLVRDAILASPAWPDMAAKMALLDQQGVDVAGFLSAAHGQGVGVDRAVAALLAGQGAAASTTSPAPAPAPAPAAAPAPVAGVPAARPAAAPNPYAAAVAPAAVAPAAAPAAGPGSAPESVVVSADARAMWGPLTQGLKVPNDLDLSDRAAALEQLDVTAAVNSRLVNMVKDYVGSERETALLVATRAWPLLAARMAGVARGPEGEQGLRARLKAGLGDDPAWEQGPPGELEGRMVGATLRALTAPPGAPVPDGPRVSAAAARSRSTTWLRQ
ncbi:hypothetical protein [Streptomyces sp. NPDC020817]|uniref:hypothetical protein n=1 Tax=Streptomyces sp. NPDC020817 TaxID=3365095 RepID=UPI00379EF819